MPNEKIEKKKKKKVNVCAHVYACMRECVCVSVYAYA